ncbi:MAG: CHAD domain-containing protein [Ignavibacteriaceae bacterium]
MTKKKKWKIKGLKNDTSLLEVARIVLKQRLNSVISSIKKYFAVNSPENLHEVRIALRRLRYNLEIFISCFDDKNILIFYKAVENLQDVTGTLRDLDVLSGNIDSNISPDEREKIILLKEKIELQRKELFEGLKLSLMEFLHSKNLKEFKKMIYN